MSIKQYNGQRIEVGQWVITCPMLSVGFAGSVAKVLEIKAKSLVVAKAHRHSRTGELDLDHGERKLLTNIAFVCDSVDEAFTVREASKKFIDSEMVIERAQNKEARDRKAWAIAAVVGTTD